MEKIHLRLTWLGLLAACLHGAEVPTILPSNYCARFSEFCRCEHKADRVTLVCAKAILQLGNPYMSDSLTVYIRKGFDLRLYNAQQANISATVGELSVHDKTNADLIIPSRDILQFLGISRCAFYVYENGWYQVEERNVSAAAGGLGAAKIKIQTGVLSADDLLVFENYTTLEITHPGIFLAMSTYLSVLQAVETLTLTTTFNCSFDLQSFAELSTLQVLRLQFTPLHIDATLSLDLGDLYDSDEDIYDISCDTYTLSFGDLQQLQEIHLAQTFTAAVIEDEMMFHGTRHLQVLSIVGNAKLRNLHGNLFHDQSELTTLNLHTNALEALPSKLFDPLNNLRTLNLSHNKYLRLYVVEPQLTNLRLLDVSYDKQVFSYQHQDRMRKVQIIESNDRPGESQTEKRTKPFVCFTHSNCKFQLAANELDCCLRDCSYMLAQDSLQFRINCTAQHTFGTYPLLIPTVGRSVAYIEDMQLATLPTSQLPGYANLTGLHASGNRLTELQPEQLPRALQYLDISNNSLGRLSAAVMAKLQQGSVQLKLAGNPWQCDCETSSLFRFVRRMHANIQDASRIYCQGHALAMLQLNATDICADYAKDLLIAAIGIGMCVAFGAVFCCLVHRQHVKLVSEAEGDAGKVFDAFLSYSTKDEDFVVEVLAQLESGAQPYKLCLHDRDWLVGECIPDRIARTIEQSRRVIIVLSQNFLDSPWGRMEFRLAYQAAMEERRKRLIIILYQEVSNFDKIDAELKAYLKLNIYLKWGDANFWRKLRYAMPHKNCQLANADDNELEYRF